MKEEIEAAVKWWGKQLREGTRQDNGDAMQSVLATMVASQMRVTPEQVDVFEKTLATLLPKYLGRIWDPLKPNFGSACRVLDCDYGAHLLLVAAALLAGIEPTCPPFPMKTVMWINPGNVQVRHGYRAPEETIWKEEEKEPCCADAPRRVEGKT